MVALISDFKSSQISCRNRAGMSYVLTRIHVTSNGKTFILVNDNFAHFAGFNSRAELLAGIGYAGLKGEVYFHKGSEQFYSAIDLDPLCLN